MRIKELETVFTLSTVCIRRLGERERVSVWSWESDGRAAAWVPKKEEGRRGGGETE